MTDNTPNAAPAVDENKLIAERKQKLSEMREQGNAFPNDFRRDAYAAALQSRFARPVGPNDGCQCARLESTADGIHSHVSAKANREFTCFEHAERTALATKPINACCELEFAFPQL